MVCKKVFENWLRNEDTASILVYYNGNSNLTTVRHTDLHTKSDQSKRSLTGSHVGGLSTYRVLPGVTKHICKEQKECIKPREKKKETKHKQNQRFKRTLGRDLLPLRV